MVRNSGGKRIKLMWAPYVRSIPDTPENAIAAYFPGADKVDLVGASGYNFGQVGGLAWTDPEALFEDVYRQVSALSPKPFWVAETGSTNNGGSRAAWIAQLAVLRTAIPNLGGIVWYDARDPNGDFRVGGKPARKAFKGLVEEDVEVSPRRVVPPRRKRTRKAAAGGAQAALTEPMVNRLMWRAGFGPSEADRQRFKGMNLHRAVNRLMNNARGRRSVRRPARRDGTPLRPESDTDLVLAWCDQMIRTRNPLVERLAFFFHRHFATQRDEVSPPQLMTQQNALFHKYSDLAANRIADFKSLVYEVGEGPAMLRFLTGEDSRKGRLNENYGRELLELFCLGVTNAAGQPNYTEADVLEAARASTGWQINDDNPDAPTAYFTPVPLGRGAKTVLGQTGAFNHRQLVNVVTSHPSHAPFFVTKLWGEFMPTAPDAATLHDLTRIYTRRRLPAAAAGAQDPHPPGDARLDQGADHDQVAGRLRHRGDAGPGPGDHRRNPLQRAARHGAAALLPADRGRLGGGRLLAQHQHRARALLGGQPPAVAQVRDARDQGARGRVRENPKQAFARAHASVGRPWVGRGTKSSLLYYATKARNTSSNDRIARQRVLRAFLLGGPDAQVM